MSEAATGRRRRPLMARRVRDLIVREGLFPPDYRALVMVSGGQDSLTLLHLLVDLATDPAGKRPAGRSGPPGLGPIGPLTIRALHVNHHLRGDESEADEALVRRACAQLGVELRVMHCPVDKTAGNVQEAARAARRAAALETADDLGYSRIALGHTADDQVETMLYRLGRYGGLAAFRSMLPLDPPWVRPLLGCRRKETAAYCRLHGLVFAEDSGNAYPDYARTGIRETVLPAWESVLPGAVEAAARSAEVAAETERVVGEVLAGACADITRPDTTSVGLVRPDAQRQGMAPPGMAPPGMARSGVGWQGIAPVGAEPSAAEPSVAAEAPALSAGRLLALSPPLRRLFLHRWLGECDKDIASRAAVLAVEALLSVSGSAERALGGGLRGRKEYDLVWLEKGRAGPPPILEPVLLTVPGAVEWGEWRIKAEQVRHFYAPDPASETFVDARVLVGPLMVRGPQPGDRFRPLGAPGTRKLHDLFVDLRVPAAQRARRPLVVCDQRIIWACGMAAAHEGRIERDTVNIVRLSATDASGPRGHNGLV